MTMLLIRMSAYSRKPDVSRSVHDSRVWTHISHRAPSITAFREGFGELASDEKLDDVSQLDCAVLFAVTKTIRSHATLCLRSNLQQPTIPLFKVFMAPSVEAAVARVLYSGYIGQGDEVTAFERELAARLGVTGVVTVNSGTSALHLACHMSVDGTADAEIISTPMTCVATNSSIVQNGARIVWADVDPLTGNIDPDEIELLITEKTQAIMMVHWGGNPCDIDRIREIGRAHDIPVIEDAAHALGAVYREQPIGRHSDFVAFSFQARETRDERRWRVSRLQEA